MRYHKIRLLCVQIIIGISMLLVTTVNAVEQQELIVNPEINSYWPAPPVRETIGGKSIVTLKEALYKKSKKIWPDLSYTDTEVKAKALRGLLWMLNYMNTGDHLEGNENNYLTMLGTIYSSARDPYLRRIAWEEARLVINRLIAADFFNDDDNDVDDLMEYLTLFNHLGIRHAATQDKTFRKLKQEKQNLIDEIKKLKSASLGGDDLYDAMLSTYYITNLKKHFPRAAVLNGLPDLTDFFEILSRYKYHLEDREKPDYAKLTDDDVSSIADDLYNITHVIFVVSDYNFYRVPKRYFKREIDYMLKYAGLISSKYHNDPDLLTEVVYVLTMLGYSKDHDVVKKGWVKMLDAQREDGSWEAFGVDEEKSAEDNNYSTFHATWVAVDMIVEPAILGEAPFYEPLKPALEKYAAGFNKKEKKSGKRN
ncbi:MAG: hypothetical protein ABSG75_11505 [Syntrophales bacterium]